MLGIGLALLAVGVLLLFIAPWAGFVAGGVGLIVLLLVLVGLGRRTTAE